MITVKDIQATHTAKHVSAIQGYVKVKERGTCIPYKGRYGIGYIEMLGQHRGQYQIYVN